MGPQEKPAALGSHLFLHQLVAALRGGACAGEGGWGLRALTGGLPPTVPLWSLRLALSFHDSAPALAASALSRAALMSGPRNHLGLGLKAPNPSRNKRWRVMALR